MSEAQPSRKQIADQARTWIGTPFQHQGHLKKLGVDCIGLIRGVMVETGKLPPDWRQKMGHIRGMVAYGRTPDGRLIELLREHMREIPVSEAQVADVVLVKFPGVEHAQHVGFLVDRKDGGIGILHAYNQGVVEHRLDDRWRRRVVAAFSFLDEIS